MQNYKISLRIKTLAKLTPCCNCFADIGTDHGYLPLTLLENYKVKKAILCDINAGPLTNAKKTLSATAYLDNVSFRLGSGLRPILENEAEVICIAGMGGGLIKDILEEDLLKAKQANCLILQPQTEQSELRVWLIKNHFTIQFDYFMNEDDKYYEIIVIRNIKNSALKAPMAIELPYKDLEFGTKILEENVQDYIHFLAYKKEKYQKVINAVQNKSHLTEKLKKSQHKISHINQLLSWSEDIRRRNNDYIG